MRQSVTLTTAPSSPSGRAAAKARVRSTGARRFTARVRSHCSGGDAGQVVVGEDGGAVHQHPHRAQVPRRRQEPLRGRGVGQVGAHRHHPRPQGLGLGGRGRRLGLARAVVEHQVAAGLGQAEGDGPAHPAGPSGDQRAGSAAVPRPARVAAVTGRKPRTDYRLPVPRNPDPKHGRWILPLIILAMIVLTITFVNSLEPAESEAGTTTTRAAAFDDDHDHPAPRRGRLPGDPRRLRDPGRTPSWATSRASTPTGRPARSPSARPRPPSKRSGPTSPPGRTRSPPPPTCRPPWPRPTWRWCSRSRQLAPAVDDIIAGPRGARRRHAAPHRRDRLRGSGGGHPRCHRQPARPGPGHRAPRATAPPPAPPRAAKSPPPASPRRRPHHHRPGTDA